jgi:hypothetical protein
MISLPCTWWTINSVFLSHQISKQYFQPWLFSKANKAAAKAMDTSWSVEVGRYLQPSRAWLMLGRRLRDSDLMELPLTSKMRRSPVRRTACTIFCGVRENGVDLAAPSLRINTRSRARRSRSDDKKGFPATASYPLPSRIPYKYSDPSREPLHVHHCGTSLPRPRQPGPPWYCASPSLRNFLYHPRRTAAARP